MRALLLTIVLGASACATNTPPPALPAPPQPPPQGTVFGSVSRRPPTGFFLDAPELPAVRFGGVHVTATSPALVQPRETMTDTDGAFRFLNLPFGTYDLTFRDPSGRVVQRRRIQVWRASRAVYVTVEEREHIAPVCVYFQTCWH